MPDNHELDEHNSRKQAEQVYDGPGHDRGADTTSVEAGYSPSLLGDSRLNSRGNAPVKAAVMQRAQQTHGNRAVQRVLQRSALEGDSSGGSAEEPIGERIRAKAGGGSSLDGGVQRTLESGIGADLSGVRVHTDGEADHMARSVDSVAFTTGNDIFFRSGAYDPGSDRGMHLLAHEATHTVQQSQGPVSGTPSAGGVSISDPSDSYEQAAEATAAAVVSGGSAAPAQRMAGPGGMNVQRAAPEEEEIQAMRSSTYSANSVPVQRAEEEEEIQPMRSSTYNSVPVQRAEEEEEIQPMRNSAYGTIPSVQRATDDEDELQMMRSSTYSGLSVQRHGSEDEEE